MGQEANLPNLPHALGSACAWCLGLCLLSELRVEHGERNTGQSGCFSRVGGDTLEGTCPLVWGPSGTLCSQGSPLTTSPPHSVLQPHGLLHFASVLFPSPQGLCTGCPLLGILFSTLFTSFLLIRDSKSTSSGALSLIPTLPTSPGSPLFAHYLPVLLSHLFPRVNFMGWSQGCFAHALCCAPYIGSGQLRLEGVDGSGL